MKLDLATVIAVKILSVAFALEWVVAAMIESQPSMAHMNPGRAIVFYLTLLTIFAMVLLTREPKKGI